VEAAQWIILGEFWHIIFRRDTRIVSPKDTKDGDALVKCESAKQFGISVLSCDYALGFSLFFEVVIIIAFILVVVVVIILSRNFLLSYQPDKEFPYILSTRDVVDDVFGRTTDSVDEEGDEYHGDKQGHRYAN